MVHPVLERVARAIVGTNNDQDYVDEHWGEWLDEARAAVDAMRDDDWFDEQAQDAMDIIRQAVPGEYESTAELPKLDMALVTKLVEQHNELVRRWQEQRRRVAVRGEAK